MSASKAPENEVISTALMAHLAHGCSMDMEHWVEAETELMRLYDEYTAIEMYEMMQPELWVKTFRAP